MDYLDRIKATDWRQAQSKTKQRVLAHRQSLVKRQLSESDKEGWRAFKKDHPVIEIAKRVCSEEGVSLEAILDPSRKMKIVRVRHRVYYEALKEGHAAAEVGRRLRRNHTSICYGAWRHAASNGLAPVTGLQAKWPVEPQTRRGERARSAKLTSKDVLEIRKSKKKPSELAEIYGVREATIYRARRGETWRHI